MSRLTGLPEERWPLNRAVDALIESTRRAGMPGMIWFAGLLYPSVSIGLAAVWVRKMADVFHTFFEGFLGWGESWRVFMLPLVFVFLRLTVGLARISTPEAWDEARGKRLAPALRRVWRAGRGLAFSAFGLLLGLTLLMFGTIAIATEPAKYVLAQFNEATGSVELVSFLLMGLLLGPLLALVTLYTALFSVLTQLALHSLIQNRRGMASALIHAWRIARNDPWATGRAIIVDAMLTVSVVLLSLASSGALQLASFEGLAGAAWMALAGFAGVARAGYWALVYRELGGLSPEDGVPGLKS